MKVLIDADGCPVVDLTVRLAEKWKAECIILCDNSHEICRPPAKTMILSKGKDSVDFALVNLVAPGDLVITQDYGLAAMCLARLAIPISQDGMLYGVENIDSLLLARHTARQIRQGGGRLKGLSKRTSVQNDKFCRALEDVMSRYL